MQVVMGIDPGAANTGFGVVRTVGDRMVALDGGVIETPPDHPPEVRLAEIHGALPSYRLARAERDGDRAPLLRQERRLGPLGGTGLGGGDAGRGPGASSASTTRRRRSRRPSAAPAPPTRASQRMVATLLGLPEPPAPDHAADAFAVAICHAGGEGRRPAAAVAEAQRAPAGQRLRAAVPG